MKEKNLEKLGVAMALLGLLMTMAAFSFPDREVMAFVGCIGFILGVIGVFLGVSSRKH